MLLEKLNIRRKRHGKDFNIGRNCKNDVEQGLQGKI
nr:MAG TPA: hypothetical protein [Caudoviricetes sp.]